MRNAGRKANQGIARIAVLTFNQGKSSKQDKYALMQNLHLLVQKWEKDIGQTPDVIAYTIQECTDDAAVRFLAALPGYRLMFHKSFSQLRLGNVHLAIFVNTTFAAAYQVSLVNIGRFTGFSRCQAAKGAVFATILINGQPYQFFGVHLPSSPNKPELRHSCLKTILQRYMHPGANVFVAGDLNYRTSLEKHPDATQTQSIMTMACNKRTNSAASCGVGPLGRIGCVDKDQLSSALHPKGALSDTGLKETEVRFCQTCRLNEQRGVRGQPFYDPKRIPSWCDRILWNIDEKRVIPGEYGDWNMSYRSDHHAVYQIFTLRQKKV